MHPTLLNLAILGYIAATGLSLAYLVQREEWLHRVPPVAPIAGWVLHTVALLARGIESGRPPLGSLPEAVSVAVWVVVLLALWVERQSGVKVLGAFVLPIVLVFSLKSTTTRALEPLDRLTYRTLALGFPFLTTGLILGVLWAGPAWGSVFAFDPLALLSFVAWLIYAGTLAGRAAVGWHGRRAAYFAIVGFAALVLTLGAGLFLPGKHGSCCRRAPEWRRAWP